ncbi:MAG: hypothetical protein KatS3mg057_3183 [Herpetosiphonaceae bacterium]|nr:MAG: hypothetical protein KatS3mg057_3183 [Herpetosiphonaceae bacterium]
MRDFVPTIKQHFDGLQDRFRIFHHYAFQTEGCFKGELLMILHQLAANGVIDDLDREVLFAARRVDITFSAGQEKHLIELKHWIIGRQRVNTYTPTFYFGDPSSVGITRDVDKLNDIEGAFCRWLLILLTSNPSTTTWETGLEKFNLKFAPRHLRAHSNPGDFPPTYFLGLLEVSRTE